MNRAINFFLRQSILVNLVTVAVIVTGIYLMASMRKEAFPNVDFDIAVVTTVYPGASPIDVEKLVTNRVERKIREVEGLKKVESTSIESRSSITITIDPDEEDKDKVLDDIQKALDKVDDLPDDAEEPELLEISSRNQPVIEITVSPLEYAVENPDPASGEVQMPTEKHLRRVVKLLKDRLEDFEDVSSASTKGYRDEEIIVEVDPDKLNYFNIPLSKFRQALAAKNVNIPGGTIKTSEADKNIRILGEFTTPQGVGRVILRSNDLGNYIRVRNVADIEPGFEEEKIIERTMGRRAISLVVIKKAAADTIELVDKIFDELAIFKTKILNQQPGKEGKFYTPAQMKQPEWLNTNVNISTANDISFYIRRRVGVLTSNAYVGLALVVMSLFFFLGWRMAVMTALGIPIAFAGAFIFLNWVGISINLISMFGLIVVLGMVVDDAIVVAENIYRHIENGVPPFEACYVGTVEVVAPVTATVTTTVCAFGPLIFMSGIMGKFIWTIPAVVIIALLMSLLESFFVLPSHLHDFTRNAPKHSLVKNENAIEARMFELIKSAYRPSLSFALRHRYSVAMGMVVVLGVSGALGMSQGFKLFPPVAVEQFFIKMEAPTGTSLEKMDEYTRIVEKEVLKLEPMVIPEEEFRYPGATEEQRKAAYQDYLKGRQPKTGVLDNVITRVGIHRENANDKFTKRGSNYAQLQIFLSPESYRPDMGVYRIIERLRNKLDFDKPVENITPLPEGGYVYSRSQPGYFRAPADGGPHELVNIEKIRSPVRVMALSRDRKKIALYTQGGFLFLVNRATGQVLAEKEVGLKKKALSFMKFIRRDKEIVASNLGGAVYRFGAKDLDELQSIARVHTTPLTDFTLTKDGKKAYSGDWSGRVQEWQWEDDEWEAGRKIIRGYDRDEKDPVISISDFESGARPALEDYIHEQEKKNPGDIRPLYPNTKVTGLFLTPDNKYLVLAFSNRQVKIYQRKDLKLVSIFSFLDEAVTATYMRGFQLYVGGEQGSIMRVNLKDLKKRRVRSEIFPGPVLDMVTIGEGKEARLIAGAMYNNLQILNRSNLNTLSTPLANDPIFTKVDYKIMQGGPPVGAEVAVIVRGEEFDTLREISTQIKQRLKAIPGALDVKDNLEEGKDEILIDIDDEEAAYSGINYATIGGDIRTAFDGDIATTIKGIDEDIDVRVIFPEKYRRKISHLNKVMVANQIGNLVPITTFATYNKAKGLSQINHYEYKRALTITANVDPALNNSTRVNQILRDRFQEAITREYPGYNIQFTGENEDTEESMQSLGKAQLIAFALIFTTLILLFKNFRHPRVVFAAIPFGLVGVFLAFFFHGLPFSFLAFFGVVGLSGVVVNDSIIMVEFINKARAKGMKLQEAIMDGGETRLRAVILTTITTVFGVLPTAYGIGGFDPFLQPMALALGWGLFFGSAIILLVIPCFYAIWEDRGYVFRVMYDREFRATINQQYRFEPGPDETGEGKALPSARKQIESKPGEDE